MRWYYRLYLVLAVGASRIIELGAAILRRFPRRRSRKSVNVNDNLKTEGNDYMFEHELQRQNDGKFRVNFTYVGENLFRDPHYLGTFETEAEALEGVEKAKQLYTEDLNTTPRFYHRKFEKYVAQLNA